MDWVLRILFGHVEGAVVVPGRAPGGATTVADLAALPSVEHPRLLVPVRGRRSAAAALRQYNQGMTRAARTRKALASVAVGAGAARLRSRRVVVAAPPGVAVRQPLEEAIAGALDLPEVRIAAFIGSARPNRKPVLQLTTPDGRVVGYAKVAWSELTRRLIATEAAALRSLERTPVPGLGTPIVLAELEWQGLGILVTSTGDHRRRRRGGLGLRPSPDVVAAVGAVDAEVRAPLADLPFTRRLRSRLASLQPAVREPAVDALHRIEDDAGDRPVLSGRWHGDWSPWNMHRTRDGWFVWDWERSETGVPVGLDTVHHAFQWALHLTGGSEDAATPTALWAASSDLPLIGQPPRMERAFVGLSLLELLLRFEEGRIDGMPVDEGPATRLVAVLSRWVEGS
jgi:hypothetical protein